MSRLGYVAVTLLAAEIFAALFVAVACLAPHPRMIWNVSASAPIGLYRLQGGGHPANGALVAILPPTDLARFMAGRRYLPEHIPLLKRVAALPGQRVCRRGTIISIDGKRAAVALQADRSGRPLPAWQGCHVVAARELFLINAAADSFDSRYFGALPASGLIGCAHAIFTRDAPDKPLIWRGFGTSSTASLSSKGTPTCS